MIYFYIHKIRVFVVFLLLFPSILYSESPDSILVKIKKYSKNIIQASKAFDISPDILAAIIYTERVLNYDWKDKLFDISGAKAGYNTSIGFCQIKISTAMWIELQYNDSTSVFYPSPKYGHKIKFSKNRQALVERLLNIDTNLLYAAAYLRLFIDYWGKFNIDISNNAGILGTLYSKGPFNKEGGIIIPTSKAKENKFGRLVKKYIQRLNKIFSKKNIICKEK